METESTDERTSSVHRSKYLRGALYLLIVVGALFALLLAMAPTLDVDMRQRANEASSIGEIDTIIKLQRSYAASHPASGYSCELSRLRSTPAASEYDPESFLDKGERLGYRYALVCRAEPDGRVLHFSVTAVPIKPKETRYRYRAFCADDSGVIRYDADGSGDTCLANGTALVR